MAQGGPKLIYSLASAVSTSDFDTGVKLFDTPKSFSILCDANANNSNWQGEQSIFGLDTTYTFRCGRVNNGDAMVDNVRTSGNSYATAVTCNHSDDTLQGKCRSLYAKSSGQKRIAVTYDAPSRTVRCFSASSSSFFAPNNAWWTLSDDIVSNDTIKLRYGNIDYCTINTFNIYNGILTNDQINDFLTNGV